MVKKIALAAFAACCLSCAPKSTLVSVQSPGVDSIPPRIGIYPLLATSITDIRPQSTDLVPLDVKLYEADGKYILSPASASELQLTKESLMITGFLATQLASQGFSLIEMPKEIPGYIGEEMDFKVDRFYISTSMLDSLSRVRNLQAVLVGNAFFRNVYHKNKPVEKRVIFSHIKLIEVPSLNVLAQITQPYDPEGVSLNDMTTQVAKELADMARTSYKRAEKRIEQERKDSFPVDGP
jgi:hypothetical protein